MNKQTRLFIWGLIVLGFCAIAVSIHVIDIRRGDPRDWFDWLLMAFVAIGVIQGGNIIERSLKD